MQGPPRLRLPGQETALDGTDSGTFANRGDYPAPLNLLLVASAGAARNYHFVGAGTDMFIDIPAATVAQVLRYDGYLHVLTVETNGVEVLRMDLLRFQNETTHPVVQPGSSGWTGTGSAIATGSRLFWAEAYS